ncbi:MAG: T9SS type A sorting domain-containing protein, partial [Candidatus Eisenbacteria bacterium]
YSFRYHTDAVGTLRDPLIFKTGGDYYHKTFGSGRNRWGDYGKAQVDPSDDLSLWVVDECAKVRAGQDDGNGGSNSSRWGSWWAKLSPTLTLAAGPSQAEGAGGTTAFHFTVSFEAPVCVPVQVDYVASNGTATLLDGDYQSPGTSIVIPAGATSGTITVDVNGDTKREPDETFHVTLVDVNPGVLGSAITATETILNDDPVPTLSIADAAASEGNAGSSTLSFQASLSNPTTQTVTAQYQTTDGTATVADNDYLGGSGTLTIAPGASSGSVGVTVSADTRCEPNETLSVTLSAPSGATLGDAQGTGTIQNDDDCVPPTVTVLAPNDQEVHLIGEPLDLRWNASDDVGVTSVDLALSRNGGGAYEDIALAEANDGSYVWTVTGPETHEALLRVAAHDAAGNAGSDVSNALWQIVQTIAVDPDSPVTELALGPATPSPAKGSMRIAYALPRTSRVRLEVLDVQGRRVAPLVDGELPAGRHRATWDASRAGSGVYVVRLDTGTKVLMKRVVVTR